MERTQYEYDEITKTIEYSVEVYECDGVRGRSLLVILEKIGEKGWCLVGEIEGKLIVRRVNM